MRALVALLIGAFSVVQVYAAGTSNLLDCTPNEEFVRDNIVYLCTSGMSVRSYKPIACISEDGVRVDPGATHVESDFEFECRTHGDDGIEWFVTRCFSKKGVPMDVGSQMIENVGTEEVPNNVLFACEEHDTSGDGKGERVVERTVSTVMVCIDGRRHTKHMIGEKVQRQSGVFVCRVKRGKPSLVAVGCVLPTGEEVGAFSVSGGLICSVNVRKNTATLVPSDIKCEQGNNQYELGDSWSTGGVDYVCELRRRHGELLPRIRAKRCVAEISFILNGQAKTQRKRVHINGVRRMNDGNYYWCKPGRPAPSIVQLRHSQTRCSNGRRVNQQWIRSNINKKCYFSRNGPTVRDRQCITDDLTPLRKNKIYDKGNGLGYICEPVVKGKLQYRTLNEHEYALYTAGSSSTVADSSFGKGVVRYDSDGHVECHEGYTRSADGATCDDIDECQEGKDSCDEQEVCRNTDGSHECLCAPGFARTDEGNCERVFCPCVPGQTCWNGDNCDDDDGNAGQGGNPGIPG